jgi:lipoprotein-anchoring transpeptidase ErfK/SrfK
MTTTEYILDVPDDQEPDKPIKPTGPSEPYEPEKKHRSIWKILLCTLLSLVGLFAFVAFCFYALFFIIPNAPEVSLAKEASKDGSNTYQTVAADNSKINTEMAALEKKVDKLTNQGPYLIVNTTENKFYLYADNKLIRQGPCSTGKNEVLIYENGKKKHYFKSPRGVHKVQSKQKDPVWSKPDWAFIEEGEPVPPAGDESRYDKNTLGPYALRLGDGYMVHGTIWKRFMGQSVTHGCIRMLDEDITAVYETLPVGSKVIIY